MEVFKSVKGKNAVFTSYDNFLNSWQVPADQVDLETSYGKTHVILAGNKNCPSLILFHGVDDNAAIMWINNAKYQLPPEAYITVPLSHTRIRISPGERTN